MNLFAIAFDVKRLKFLYFVCLILDTKRIKLNSINSGEVTFETEERSASPATACAILLQSNPALTENHETLRQIFKNYASVILANKDAEQGLEADRVQDAFQKGREEGRRVGKALGLEEGEITGYEQGLEEGKTRALQSQKQSPAAMPRATLRLSDNFTQTDLTRVSLKSSQDFESQTSHVNLKDAEVQATVLYKENETQSGYTCAAACMGTDPMTPTELAAAPSSPDDAFESSGAFSIGDEIAEVSKESKNTQTDPIPHSHVAQITTVAGSALGAFAAAYIATHL